MDPFHVVAPAGTALDQCRQRIQQATLARRGRTGDPLYGIRKTLRTGKDYLTEKQRTKLETVFANSARSSAPDLADLSTDHGRVPSSNRAQAKHNLVAVIDAINTRFPTNSQNCNDWDAR